MKKSIIISLALVVILIVGLLVACNGVDIDNSNIDVKVNFIVDGEVVHTLDVKSGEEINLPKNPEKKGMNLLDGMLIKIFGKTHLYQKTH
jgi:hypothetical protein